MGIFTPHSCEELQTWPTSSEVSFLGVSRESHSQDLCYLYSYCLCGEDKRIMEIHPTLLVSFISPHKAISSQSVSWRLSRALCLAGIELNYTGHSTRGASTSAAAVAGLSADLILEAADWAFVQTFERFYHRVICSYLRKAVLNG